MEYSVQRKQPSNRGWWAAGALASLTLFAFWKLSNVQQPAFVNKAVVVLKGDSTATGTVVFTQTTSGGPVTIKGDLTGLRASASQGFHIHQAGDLTSGCASAGPHFNPFAKNHGAPDDSDRHVGDLGNIHTDHTGGASFEFEDSEISLNGPLSIIGRAVVLHADADDLGRGGNPESLKTGNAGARAACGVIGLS
ncbi:unnamed protein product [Mycena citricolor]|uniref:Superoxide dismutase [Cu-Zn] n=1 Tax=Mycena citricolor TaxID=2018698 RepID=A0AAD2HXK2_9AGAR|nr:unnamed protein product [Mycena citricolor]